MLKMKLEKVEKERNEVRLNNDRLESRVNTTSFITSFITNDVTMQQESIQEPGIDLL